MYSKSQHIRTYQNMNLEAIFPKLYTFAIKNQFQFDEAYVSYCRGSKVDF